MTWTKLSDDFSDDCWELSSDAFRTHVEGLNWSNRKLLDLRIPKHDFRRFAKVPDAVTELLATGWWADVGDAYLIRHHGVYQRTREAVLNQQAAQQANGRKGGRPPKPPRERVSKPEKTQRVSEWVSDRVSDDDAVADVLPVPSPAESLGRGPSETQWVSERLSQRQTQRDRPGLVLKEEVPQSNGNSARDPQRRRCDRCPSPGPCRRDGLGDWLCEECDPQPRPGSVRRDR